MNTTGVSDEIEGFLLWEAEKDRARARARAFCTRMPWLTDSQREEAERLYAEDHLDVLKVSLERVVARSGELRAEYEGVYRALRSRIVTAFALGATATVVAAFAIAVR
jgi:hypothetical protein